MNLTPQGSQIIEELARRHSVSVDAAITLLQAVINGGGTMAQFSHSELGGSGQWMQGGMTMVGDMFNNALKAKVDSLCSELSGLAANQPLFAQPTPSYNQGQGESHTSLFVSHSGGQGWPAELGMASSSGSQNNIRYAVFPATRRLAIEVNGQMTIYDTLNHQIGGVGQQQGSDASLTFTSQFGLVRTTELPIISNPGSPSEPIFQPQVSAAPAEWQPTQEEGDVFAKIERLAELRQKGILSDEEFSSKKAELMSRL